MEVGCTSMTGLSLGLVARTCGHWTLVQPSPQVDPLVHHLLQL